MEGSRRHPEGSATSTPRSSFPVQEKAGTRWMGVLHRLKGKIGEDNVSIVAGGTAFFLLLGMVPGLAALISIYGLIANPSDVQAQFDALARVLPPDVKSILETQMTRIASERQTAGFAAFVSIGLALWGGSAAMKTVMNALNIIHHEKEKRGYLGLTFTALGLTFVLILMGALAIGLSVILPPVLSKAGLGAVAKLTVSLLRWPVLFALIFLGLAIIYRYAPSRETRPLWRSVLSGATVATLISVVVSGLFSVYVQHFGKYNETYGSLGAVVVLMLWLYLCAFALLIGAEINADAEQLPSVDLGQTARSSFSSVRIR